MNVETNNGIKIYTPCDFEDVFELTREIKDMTKCVIVDCRWVRVLPSHFISVAISKKNCIVLVCVSHTALNIFKTIGVENDIIVRHSVYDAIKYIEGKV